MISEATKPEIKEEKPKRKRRTKAEIEADKAKEVVIDGTKEVDTPIDIKKD